MHTNSDFTITDGSAVMVAVMVVAVMVAVVTMAVQWWLAVMAAVVAAWSSIVHPGLI